MELAFRTVKIMVGAYHFVVSDGEEGTAKRVEKSRGGRIGVGGCFIRGCLLLRPLCAALALRVSGFPSGRLGLEKLMHIASDVRVCARVSGLCAVGSDSVVDVICCLFPWIEHHLFICLVGM